MKKLFIMIALTVAVVAVFAQSPLAGGGTQLNAGVGLSSRGTPIYAGLDFGLGRDFTAGGEVSYRAWNESSHWNHTIIGISGNLNYHFNTILKIPRNWDLYAGANLGYYIFSNPDDYDGSYHSQLGLAGQIGGRYYFTNKVGINLEFGGGNAFSGGKLGVSVKL